MSHETGPCASGLAQPFRMRQQTLVTQQLRVAGRVFLAVVAGEFLAERELLALLAKGRHGGFVVGQCRRQNVIRRIAVLGNNCLLRKARFHLHLHRRLADAQPEQRIGVCRQPQPFGQLGCDHADAAGKAGAKAQAFGGDHGILCCQCRVGDQRDQRLGRARSRKASAGGLAAQHGPPGEDPVFAAGANLWIAGLGCSDLLAQRGIGDADDGVVLAVHPRRGLARGIQHGLHLLGRDLVCRIELAVGAMLVQGLEYSVHGLICSRGWGAIRAGATGQAGRRRPCHLILS